MTVQYEIDPAALSPTQFVLGDFVFSLTENTPASGLSRKFDGGWTVIDLLNDLPAQQQTGRKLDEITLQCEWFLDEGAAGIEKLKKVRDQKKPLSLVRGDGTILGQWVLVGFDTNEEWMFQEGKTMKQHITINLREFANKPAPDSKGGKGSNSSSNTGSSQGGKS